MLRPYNGRNPACSEPLALALCNEAFLIRGLGFDHEFMDVAPEPVFAWFEGADDGVFGGVKVLGGVLVF